MYAVSAADLADVRRTLNAISAEAGDMVYDAVVQLDFTDVAAAREACIEIMEQVLGPMADLAAEAGVDWYNLVREKSTGKSLGTGIAAPARNPKATEEAVHALIQNIVDGKSVEDFAGLLKGRADYEIKKAFGDSVSAKGRNDPMKPRWARVTQGDTCLFCIMLASRGFVYHSKAKAVDHYHEHCDCIATPGFPGTSIEGYNLEALQAKYADEIADKARVWSQKATAKRRAARTKYANFDAATKALAEAKSIEELQERSVDTFRWLNTKYTGQKLLKRGAAKLNAAYSKRAKELTRESL